MQNCTDSGISCFSTPQTNMDLPLNEITIKVYKYTKYEIKMQNSFRFLFFPNILSFPSFILADKRD